MHCLKATKNFKSEDCFVDVKLYGYGLFLCKSRNLFYHKLDVLSRCFQHFFSTFTIPIPFFFLQIFRIIFCKNCYETKKGWKAEHLIHKKVLWKVKLKIQISLLFLMIYELNLSGNTGFQGGNATVIWRNRKGFRK